MRTGIPANGCTWYFSHRPELARLISRPQIAGSGEAAAVLDRPCLPDEERAASACSTRSEFLSPYGVRSLSRVYLDQPYVFESEGYRSEVKYTPAESDSDLFGGNSNWRGPVWMPVNFLMVESLDKFGSFYGDDFRVECPTGSGQMLTLNEVANELRRRLIRIFLRDAQGRRPVYNGYEKLQTDSCSSRTTSGSMNISTAIMAGALALRTRPAGPASSPT